MEVKVLLYKKESLENRIIRQKKTINGIVHGEENGTIHLKVGGSDRTRECEILGITSYYQMSDLLFSSDARG